MNVQEVAPPGFGHTKGDKEKGVKKGGPAAAFDRARKEGRFKGSKSDMFAIMWSQKNKGDKPHYKPGTDKKYKKYEKNEDWKPEIEVIDTKKEAKKREKKRKEAESSLPPHLRLDTMKKAFSHTNESAVLDANTKIKDKADRKKKEKEYARLISVLQHRKKMKEMGLGEEKDLNPSVEIAKMRLEKKKKEDAKKKKAKALAKSKQRATGALRKHDSDGDGYVRVIDAGYKPEGEVVQDSFEIDKIEHKKKQKERKMRNLSIDNTNKNEADVAHKKAGGPKLAFEGWQDKAKEAMKRVAGRKKEERKAQPATDAGARARKRLKDAEHHDKVSFLDAPDD